MKQTIFVGVTTDNELYFINIEQPTPEHNYFAMSGDSYRLIEEKQGEIEARERLEDGELWKMAVESDSTTSSLSTPTYYHTPHSICYTIHIINLTHLTHTKKFYANTKKRRVPKLVGIFT